ncbi:type II secretion system protein GspM [Lichenicoccus sp.]|uniref:type II secretion system protein GspM n=1 Tax=Lichenicoccus sp. TaxID=2781899 RepID=UPI003D14045E
MALALPLPLPGGQRGRILALLLTLLAAALLWWAAAGPLLGWYADRQDGLAQREALATRMALLVQRLPALRQQVRDAAHAGDPGAHALIEGSSDAVAGAAIQEKVAALATALGVSLSSTETLAGAPDGAYRRVGVRISLDAPFPVVVHLLAAIDSAQPSLLVDDLQMHGARILGQPESAPLNVAFTVLGFRHPDQGEAPPDARAPAGAGADDQGG